MSGHLMSLNALSGFAQQGSVDRVALSNTSVQFSVTVLSRLSKAGIDAFTLQVGRAICYNFALELNSQKRISYTHLEAQEIWLLRRSDLVRLRYKGSGDGSCRDSGGIDPRCLCAAYSTTYDSLFAAKVVKELCVLYKAPQSFTAALRRWKVLVKLWSGILSSAHFVVLANGFRRLISGASPHIVEARCTPTTYSALAEAILTLARVSKHNLVNGTFLGGLDCAWLVVFAEWILSLEVGICDPNGSFLYYSRGSTDGLPQMTIILPDTTRLIFESSLLESKAVVILCGQSLLQKDPALRGIVLFNWQESWSTILHDVFHNNIDGLLNDNTGHAFAVLFKSISALRRRDNRGVNSGEEALRLTSSWTNHPVIPLLWAHHGSSGQTYLEFATKRLPELSACLSTSAPFPQTSIEDSGDSLLTVLWLMYVPLLKTRSGG